MAENNEKRDNTPSNEDKPMEGAREAGRGRLLEALGISLAAKHEEANSYIKEHLAAIILADRGSEERDGSTSIVYFQAMADSVVFIGRYLKELYDALDTKSEEEMVAAKALMKLHFHCKSLEEESRGLYAKQLRALGIAPAELQEN